MGSGPSNERRKELIEKEISGLPSPTTVFPGYYEKEFLFLENKTKILEYCDYISKIDGFILEKFEIPNVSSSLDFLLNYYSVGSALLAIHKEPIEQNVVNHLNTFIRSKLLIVDDIHRLLQTNDLEYSEKIGYIINGITGCQEIVNLIRDEASHLFKNPLVSAPVLVNLVPLYINLLIKNYSETKSEAVRNDLVDKVKTLKHTVDRHMSRAMVERLRHINREIININHCGSINACYDYLFPEKLRIFSAWCDPDQLCQEDIGFTIVSVYKDRVIEAYDSYFQTSASIIDSALKRLEDVK